MAVFAVGVLVILGLAVVYVWLGHSWNVAASQIDVTIQALDRFDVVLVEGVSERYFPGYDEDAATPAQKAAAQAASARMAEIAERYREGGASVLELDATDATSYREGRVLVRDGTRYGVLSVASGEKAEDIQEKVDALVALNVRAVVAVVPYQQCVRDVEGIDVAVCRNDPFSRYDEGKPASGTFCVSPPDGQGSVRAILMSSNDAIITKTFAEGEDVLDLTGMLGDAVAQGGAKEEAESAVERLSLAAQEATAAWEGAPPAP